MPDRVFLALESARTPQHVAALATYALPAGAQPDDYMRRLYEQFAAAPVVAPFTYQLPRSRFGFLAGSWQVLAQQDIDRSFHLRRHALPAPGGERELLDLVSRLHALPLDTARPLWECHVIEGLADGRFALYLKVHHAYTDGLGFQQRFRRMMTADPHDESVQPLWSIVTGVDDDATAPADDGTTAARRSANRVDELKGTAVGLGRAAESMVKSVRDKHNPARAVPFAIPRSPFNRAVGRQRLVIIRHYGLDRFRAVAKAADVTLNEVLLSVCGGALRRCLAATGALPASSMTAGTPVSTRAAGDTTSANAIAMTVMSLGTDIADPLDRLRIVARSSAIAKRELRELPSNAVDYYGELFTWPFVAQNLLGLGGATRPPYNIVVSNIRSSPEQNYLAGAPLESTYPLGSICHGVGLFIAAISSAGQLNLCFLGDGELPVSLDDLGDLIGEEIGSLERAVGLPADVGEDATAEA